MAPRLVPGHTRTLGATAQGDGVNFALAAPNAEGVTLCLFDAAGQVEQQRLPMPARQHGIWHGHLAGAGPGLVYGWRVHGPWAPHQGHRFNSAKLLLDPCARDVVGSYGGQDIHQGYRADDPQQPDPRDNVALAMKARVVGDLPAVAGRVPVEPARRVLYELHVKGTTALHPGVPPHQRGTYAGLAHPAVLEHLQRLGVTTLCLMPVAQRADERRLLQAGLTNYWGYSPIAWSAPEQRYWSGATGTSPRSEFRSMVDALHAAGFEVILDVVYNHTGETDELGPSLSLRGVDNATYYHLEPGAPQHYLNWTGCGNCVNLNQPLVLRTVMDSLRLWVQDYGVDGFRFDLAPVLARGDAPTQFAYSATAPLLMALAQDPLLRERLLVAEPWDIGPDGYQLGAFPPAWLEWNDRFRDTQRGFWLHAGQVQPGQMARRLSGSADVFDPRQRSACSSVNFVTAHDGFNLTDLVSYAHKHNQANGENNRDGHGHNLSVNNGHEGPTVDPAIHAQRLRQKRALLAVTVLSLGTPMLLAGDEFGHTQQGNNNAYCQDNTTTWLDWMQADLALAAYVARLLRVRIERTLLQSATWWSAAPADGPVLALWRLPNGQALDASAWHDPHGQCVALHLTSGAAWDGEDPAGADCLLLMNASADPVLYQLPRGNWYKHIDSADPGDNDVRLPAQAVVPAGSLWLASTHVCLSHAGDTSPTLL